MVAKPDNSPHAQRAVPDATVLGEFRPGEACGILLAAVGIVPYIACAFMHVCMAGHMHHPPYPWWAFVVDGAWIACFSAAAIITLWVRPRTWQIVFVVLLVLLTASRLTGFLSMFMLFAEAFGLAILIAIPCGRLIYVALEHYRRQARRP